MAEEKGEEESPLTADDEKKFYKKHSFTEPQSCPNTRRGFPCRKNPTWSPVWKDDGGSWPPPGRQCIKRYRQFARFKGKSVIYYNKCDECYAVARRKDKNKKKKKKKKALELAQEGKKMCYACSKWPEKHGIAFDEGEDRCQSCVKRQIENDKQYRSAAKRAALPGEKWCDRCKDYKATDEFMRTYMNLRTNERKEVELECTCVSCADECLTGITYQKHIQQREGAKMEMAEEKLRALEEIQQVPGVNGGCCSNCPFDLNHVFETIENLHDKTVANRICSRLLEWDHNDPLTKTQNCSEIYNKAKRLVEIAKCTLRCIFCHRLKTYKNGDGKYNDRSAPTYTRKYFQDRLAMKQELLARTGKDGHCPGPGFDEDSECPFVDDMKEFRETLNTRVYDSSLEKEQLAMLLYDADHNDKLLKDHQPGQPWTPEELQKCTMRCCACHQIKTVCGGETASNWVVVDSDGNPLAPVHEREVEGKPMTTWNMEWRVSSFM